jgi:hypothetical protein
VREPLLAWLAEPWRSRPQADSRLPILIRRLSSHRVDRVDRGTWRWLCILAMLIALTSGCAMLAPPPPPAPNCAAPPDAFDALVRAWHDYQPDTSPSWTVTIRRRLFSLQALLLSAGMYAEPPADPAAVYPLYAAQFVRDLGVSRNAGTAAALVRLADTLEQLRAQSDAELGANCALVEARRALRNDPDGTATEWVVQTVTFGFAPYFQASVQQLVSEHARACMAQPEIAAAPESILTCTLRRVGL